MPLTAEQFNQLKSGVTQTPPVQRGGGLTAEQFNQLKLQNTKTIPTKKSRRDERINKAGKVVGTVFGGDVIGEAIGTKIAKRKFRNQVVEDTLTPEQKQRIAEQMRAKGIDESTISSVINANVAKQDILNTQFEGPSAKEILGDVARIGANFIPVGKGANLVTKGLSKLGAGAGLANVGGKVIAGAGQGYAFDVSEKMRTNKEKPLTPGLGTAIGGVSPLAGPVLKAVGAAGRQVTGLTTGAGAPAIKEFGKAVAKGGEQAKVAQRAMRGQTSPEEIVNAGREALNTVKTERGRQFAQRLKQVFGETTRLDEYLPKVKQGFEDSLAKFGIKRDANGVLNFRRATINNAAQKDVAEISALLDDFGKLPEDNTVQGFDFLKRRLDDFVSDSSQAKALITSLRQDVRSSLSKIKGYDKMAKGYEEASELIKDAEQALIGKSGASKDTAFRKIMTSLRGSNDIRRQLLNELNEASGGTLIPKVAGQSLSEVVPQSLVGKIGALTTVGAGGAGIATGGVSFLPIFAALATVSPRVVGEIANILGIAGRNVAKLENILLKAGVVGQVLPSNQ